MYSLYKSSNVGLTYVKFRIRNANNFNTLVALNEMLSLKVQLINPNSLIVEHLSNW